jgi:hypothetical protein
LEPISNFRDPHFEFGDLIFLSAAGGLTIYKSQTTTTDKFKEQHFLRSTYRVRWALVRDKTVSIKYSKRKNT